MRTNLSVNRANPVMAQDVSQSPLPADAQTPVSSPSRLARTASGPLQGLRPTQAQHIPTARPEQDSGGDAGPVIEAPGLSPEPRPETAQPSIQAQHALAVDGDPVPSADDEPPIKRPYLPPGVWTEITRQSDPMTQQRLRVVGKTLKEAAEAGIPKLTVTTPEGLAAVKRAGNYPVLKALTLVGDFQGSDLEGLPTTLRELDLSGCRRLRVDELGHLLELPLVQLNIRGCGLGDNGAQLLAKHPTLTSLDASDNGIGDAGVTALARNTTLTTLRLDDNRFGLDAIRDLANNKTLTTLTVNKNRIDPAGAALLAANTTLTAVEIEDNAIGDPGAQQFAANKTLTELNIRKNEISPAGGLAFGANRTLVSLKVGHNSIGSEAVIALLANKGLTSLDIEFTNISGAVAEIAAALAASTSLVSVSVGTNCFRDAGIQLLAASKTIKTLDASYSQAGLDGALALAANKTITSLDLTGNLIGIAGVKALAENTTLTTLGVGRSELTHDGVEVLVANRTLTSLNVSGNGLDPAIICMLLTRMKLTELNATACGCDQIAKADLTALAASVGVTLRI